MTDRDQTVIFSLNGGNGDPDRLGAYDDFAATEDRPADVAPGLVSLGFIVAAVGRSARFLFVMAVVGLLLGIGVNEASAHKYQATASVLLTLSPYEDSQSAPLNNTAIAETRAVAGLALNKLGLQQSVSSFLNTYTVTSVTDLIMNVTATAPSSNQAELEASTVANAFLQFRASEQQGEQNLVVQSLNQQTNQAKQRVSSIDAQISRVSGQVATPTQQSQLRSLRAEESGAANTLTSIQQAVTINQVTTQPVLTAALKGSQVLSVAPLPHSKLKALITYAVIGLIGGLVLSLAIIIIRALVSDRLRQRDDIAYALDAPVKLSVGPLRARQGLRWPGRGAKQELDLRRVIARLQSALPRSTHGPAGLAIVAVDNAPVVARAVAALAASYASQGNQVVAADLSWGAHMAQRLGVKSPGAHVASQNGVNFMLAVPNRDDPAPVGPLRKVTSPPGPPPGGDTPFASFASADVLLSLVTLDPALGGDFLATWATHAIVVVSAGQSSAEKIQGVGEMIRLAGTRLDSVVLIGADKGDESLGLTPYRSRTPA
jgi:capsular polysaccharide biosynthesis protein